MTTVAQPTTSHDANTRWYLDLLIESMKPPERPDVGRWLPLVEMAEEAYASGVNGNRGKIVAGLIQNWIQTEKFPGLEAMMLSGASEVPSAEQSPRSAEVEPEHEIMPALPESARVPEGLSRGAAFLMERYIDYSKLVSPEGFDDFHPDTFLWILSTIAGRRLKIPFAQKEYTPLMILLVSDSSMYKKSTTARVGVNVLQAAGLRWLLGADRTTPQKSLTDMAGKLPKDYESLDADTRFRTERRLSMAAQRGWRYDEFGELIRALNKGGGIMDDLKGLLLQLDACEDQYEYSTQNRGTELIEKPYLALIGTMTPSDILDSAKSGNKFWHDGFWARFIFCVPPEGTYKDCPFDLGEIPVPYELWSTLKDWHQRLGGEPSFSVEEIKDDKGKILKYVYHRDPLPEVTCKFGDGVHDAWKRYRSALKQLAAHKDLKDFRASYDRLPTKAIRVAALLASLENDNLIEMKHWAKAQEIAERWRKSLHELYNQVNTPIDETSYAKKIENEIERVVKKLEARGEPPTLRDLGRYLTRIDSGRIKMSLADMVRAKILVEDKTSHAVKYRMNSEEEEK